MREAQYTQCATTEVVMTGGKRNSGLMRSSRGWVSLGLGMFGKVVQYLAGVSLPWYAEYMYDYLDLFVVFQLAYRPTVVVVGCSYDRSAWCRSGRPNHSSCPQ